MGVVSEGKVWRTALLGLVVAIVLAVMAGTSAYTAEQPVKKSKSGICHCPGGQYYARTSSHSVFDSIDACLASGGRHPKRGQGECFASGEHNSTSAKTQSQSPANRHLPRRYDRDVFGGWADADGDCQNTRHELLIDLSRIPVHLSKNGCRVIQGHWKDPYTGVTHRRARDLHIDHLVPLYYAWKRGADRWEPAKQRRFMNDPANLLVVGASVNRKKGAKGPLAWLPPDRQFHCEYLVKFTRITTRYNLNHSPREQAGLERLTAEKCD